MAEYAAQGQAYNQNKRAALTAQRQSLADIAARQTEEQKAFSQQEESVRRQSAYEQGLGRVSAGASGVDGVSVDLLLGDIQAQEGTALQTIQDNEVITLDQLQRMKAGVVSQTEARINAVPRPSLLNAALKIGAAGLGTATQFARRSPTGLSQAPAVPTGSPASLSFTNLPKIKVPPLAPPIINRTF